MKYKFYENTLGWLIEECPFKKDRIVKIGSTTCVMDCGECTDFNYDNDSGWIVCRRLNEKFREEKLNRILNENKN